MKFLRISVLLTSIAILSACVSAPSLQSARPKNLNAQEIQVEHSTLLDTTNHMLMHVDSERNILYFQNQGGGGVALGLLGPFGVAANISMIESKTKSDVDSIKGKIKINTRQAFIGASKSAGLSISSDGKVSSTKLSPYLYIVKSDEENLLVAVAIMMEQEGASTKWVGKYMRQLPISTTVEELTKNGDEFSHKIELLALDGYSEIIKVIESENQDKIQMEQKVTFKSNFLNPRFDFAMFGNIMEEKTDVLWIRTTGGVYGLSKKNVSYTLSK